MIGSILLSFLPYAFVTAFTPGPNNILALKTISSRGWKKGKWEIIGIASGFICVMLLCAIASFELLNFIPRLTGGMKYIGFIYIIWLAIHVALSKPSKGDEIEKGSFWTGFVLQFVNVKIIIYAITIYTGYVIPVMHSVSSLLIAALVNTL